MKNYYHTYRLLLVYVIGLFCCISCNDDSDATPISVWFDYKAMPKEVYSGARMNIKAQLYTGGDERISKYTVVFDDGRNDVNLKSESFDNPLSSYLIDFNSEVPYIQDDSANCKIKICVEGIKGFSSSINYSLKVHGALKDNSGGFRLYSAKSSGKNGFNLSDPSVKCSKADTDSLDVYFYYDCPEEEWTRNCEGWKTDSKDVNFLRINTYDYSTATVHSLQTIYESSTKSLIVEEIKAGDVIIVGYKNRVWGVFCCLAYDDGAQLYTFSYKQTNI